LGQTLKNRVSGKTGVGGTAGRGCGASLTPSTIHAWAGEEARNGLLVCQHSSEEEGIGLGGKEVEKKGPSDGFTGKKFPWGEKS